MGHKKKKRETSDSDESESNSDSGSDASGGDESQSKWCMYAIPVMALLYLMKPGGAGAGSENAGNCMLFNCTDCNFTEMFACDNCCQDYNCCFQGGCCNDCIDLSACSGNEGGCCACCCSGEGGCDTNLCSMCCGGTGGA